MRYCVFNTNWRASTLVVLLANLLGGASTQAVLIQHNGNTIFYDDFESAPAVVTDITTDLSDADPVAGTGTWVVMENNSGNVEQPHWVQVTSDSVNTAGAAFQGNNFLHPRVRPAGTDTRPWLDADYSSITGGTLHFETMYRNNNIADGITDAQFTFLNGGSYSGPIVRADPVSGEWIVFTNNVGATASTGFAIDADELWHKLEIDINLDTGFYSMTLDGVTSATFNSGVANITTNRFEISPAGFGSGYNPRFDLDAIPEPASFSLLTLGGIGLMMRRRSHR